MKEWSNKTIFILLVVTLVIIVAGTSVNVSRLLLLKDLSITGAATASATGNTTITISQSTSITNNFATIQFGSGFTNASCSACYMDSNGTITNSCCGTFNLSNDFGFLLENTGNINLSVNYTCAGNCTAAQFIGGTSPAFQLRVTNNSNAGQSGEVGAADSQASCSNDPFNGFNFSSGYRSITAAGDWICGNTTSYPLDFTDSRDAFVVDLNVSVPNDAPPSGVERSTRFTFNALATG